MQRRRLSYYYRTYVVWKFTANTGSLPGAAGVGKVYPGPGAVKEIWYTDPTLTLMVTRYVSPLWIRPAMVKTPSEPA